MKLQEGGAPGARGGYGTQTRCAARFRETWSCWWLVLGRKGPCPDVQVGKNSGPNQKEVVGGLLQSSGHLEVSHGDRCEEQTEIAVRGLVTVP